LLVLISPGANACAGYRFFDRRSRVLRCAASVKRACHYASAARRGSLHRYFWFAAWFGLATALLVCCAACALLRFSVSAFCWFALGLVLRFAAAVRCCAAAR